jgi:hypothetical protein
VRHVEISAANGSCGPSILIRFEVHGKYLDIVPESEDDEGGHHLFEVEARNSR